MHLPRCQVPTDQASIRPGPEPCRALLNFPHSSSNLYLASTVSFLRCFYSQSEGKRITLRIMMRFSVGAEGVVGSGSNIQTDAACIFLRTISLTSGELSENLVR